MIPEEFKIVYSNYLNNNRKYIGMVDEDGYPYCDITENHPELSYDTQTLILDGDFLQFCFSGDDFKCFNWCALNIPGFKCGTYVCGLPAIKIGA